MAGIPWPTEPFYILSQVNDTDLVVGVNSENHAVLEPLTGTADQLWMATSDARGGARLTNPISGLALYARPADSTWAGVILRTGASAVSTWTSLVTATSVRHRRSPHPTEWR